MDSGHALHGHPPSMSCEYEPRACAAEDLLSSTSSPGVAIATVILHTSAQDSPLTTGSPIRDRNPYSDAPLEAYVPLPPSPPGSEGHTQDEQAIEDDLMLDEENGQVSAGPEVQEDCGMPGTPPLTDGEERLEILGGFVRPEEPPTSEEPAASEPEEAREVPAHDMLQETPQLPPQEVLHEVEMPALEKEVHSEVSGFPTERASSNTTVELLNDVQAGICRASSQDIEVACPQILCEEGPGLRTLGIPSDAYDGHDTPTQHTPTQDVAQSFPLGLDDVLEIFRRSHHEARRCSILKEKVYDSLHQHGRRKRLAPALAHRRRQLARCHREDAPEFASLYAEIPDLEPKQHDMPGSSSSSSSSSLTPDSELSGSGLARGPSWIAQLPDESRSCLLHLLDRVRGDEDFLAERFVRLPPAYLEHLSRLHSHDPDVSLIARPFGGRNSSRPPSRLSHTSDSYESLETIRTDPLQVLIHSFFDGQAAPDSMERLRREKVWASVCSNLINHDVHGAERLVVAVLNEFASRESWQLGPQLETLLLKWIQSGASILDPDSAPTHRGESEEAKVARTVADQTRLIENALEQFLSLLAQNPKLSIPTSSLELIRSTMAKVDNDKKDYARRFFFSSWYCQSYLTNALTCPEVHGIMQKQHLRRDIRTKILQGVSARLKTTFEAVRSGYPQDNGFASPSAMDQARALLELFDTPRWPLKSPSSPSSRRLTFLSVTVEEMLYVILTLFPQNDKSPDTSGSSLFGRAFSVASSITGGSRATTAGSLTPMLGTVSSAAPSTSSTSITSDTFFSEHASGADTMSTGISEDNSAVFHLDGSATPRSESKLMSVSRELRSLIGSLRSRKPSTNQVDLMEETAAIIFLSQDGLSSEEPRPGRESGCQASYDATPRAVDSEDITMDDVIHACFMDMIATQTPRVAGPDASIASDVGDYLACKVRAAQISYDFVSALHWHKAMSVFESSATAEQSSAVRAMALRMGDELETSEALSGMYEDWMTDLAVSDKTLRKELNDTVSSCKALRDKQWFASVVCHSSVYMDTLNVTKALATMATGKSSKQGGIAGFMKRKLKVSFGSERAQAQALAMLSASKQHGGPCKLTDTQAELTADWLTNNSIENFCSGEERIHRFCYEVQRCTQKLVADSMIASPVLWSSSLFEKEKMDLGGLQAQRTSWSIANTSPTPRQGATGQSPTLHTSSSRIFPFSLSPSQSRQNSGIRDFASLQPVHPRPSILDSSIRFSTPPENALGLQTPFSLPPSPISPGASVQRHELSPRQKSFLTNLRRTVTGLLLSDLSLFLWPNGTETDRWVNEERLHHESVSVKIGSPSHPDLTQLARSPAAVTSENSATVLYRPRHSSEPPEDETNGLRDEGKQTTRFPYEDAYVRLLTRFQLSSDPFQKLDNLYELVRLISLGPELSEDASRPNSSGLAAKLQAQYAAGLPSRSLPRTGLTKLQEATLNCEERRMQALTLTPLPRAPAASVFSGSSASSWQAVGRPAGDEWMGDLKVTKVIQALLLDRVFYPATLYRDLQLIAAFVPGSFLDASREGAAFWTLGLAAMQLKSALCAGMIDRAAQITNFHVDRGNKASEPIRQDRIDSNGNFKNGPDAEYESSASAAAERHRAASPNRNYQSRNLTEAELRMTGLADAGRLFRLAALEGDPAAARELGLFYLTHPEHVRRTLRPLSKPSDVARMAGSASATGPERPERRTNGTFAAKVEHGFSGSRGSNGMHADDDTSMDIDEVPVDGRDPANLATAWHWMESAADGGDIQAKTFLTNNTELRWDAQGRRI